MKILAIIGATILTWLALFAMYMTCIAAFGEGYFLHIVAGMILVAHMLLLLSAAAAFGGVTYVVLHSLRD